MRSPCPVMSDLNKYLADMDEESLAGDMKDNFYQSIMAEKRKLLEQNPFNKGDELMAELLSELDWEDVAYHIRCAFVSRLPAAEVFGHLIEKTLNDMVEIEAEQMYQRYLDVQEENRDLRNI